METITFTSKGIFPPTILLFYMSACHIVIIVQLAKQLHPDTNKNDPEAEKKFQEVQKAYEVCTSSASFQHSISAICTWHDKAVSFVVGFEGRRKTCTI